MLWDVVIALVSAAAGFLGMLFMMLAWFGDSHAHPIVPGMDDLDPATGDAYREPGDGPFIPMPEALKSRDEMVAWMTTELPKLTAAARPRV